MFHPDQYQSHHRAISRPPQPQSASYQYGHPTENMPGTTADDHHYPVTSRVVGQAPPGVCPTRLQHVSGHPHHGSYQESTYPPGHAPSPFAQFPVGGIALGQTHSWNSQPSYAPVLPPVIPVQPQHGNNPSFEVTDTTLRQWPQTDPDEYVWRFETMGAASVPRWDRSIRQKSGASPPPSILPVYLQHGSHQEPTPPPGHEASQHYRFPPGGGFASQDPSQQARQMNQYVPFQSSQVRSPVIGFSWTPYAPNESWENDPRFPASPTSTASAPFQDQFISQQSGVLLQPSAAAGQSQPPHIPTFEIMDTTLPERQHDRLHVLTVGQLFCPMCQSFKILRRGELLPHLGNVHGLRPKNDSIRCLACEGQPVIRHNISRHILEVHCVGRPDHECPCGYETWRKQIFDSHVKSCKNKKKSHKTALLVTTAIYVDS
ncbi:hypothetical protein ARMGADRAFT_1010147 [Armillaria gallica]|uniref:Uncharacterized protein n=1 Tax=Armillaria gallica TaxID=47427 RepID=A0A2H3DML5_ARMGA|nr:hypothetical protein ARMGADRAFT_1010147 [Armillaria gallica]